MLKYEYIFQVKYTAAISSNSTRKLLWFEITKMLIAVQPSPIRSAVLIELRLVADGRTDTGPWLVPRMHNIAW